MTDGVAPEFVRFVAAERRANRLEAVARPMAEGEVFRPVRVANKQATELFQVAARRASGLYRPSKRTEVVWVDGENELAVSLTDSKVALTLKKGGLCRLTVRKLRYGRCATLEWLLTPKQLVGS